MSDILHDMEAVIFIGIPAAGKTTFYLRYFFKTHVRINLDMLKTRRRESILMTACFSAQQKFVSDNTNRTPDVRAAIIQPARTARFKIIGYYFDTPLDQAILRNAARPDDERIPDKGVGGAYKELVLPSYREGFDTLYTVRSVTDGEFELQENPHEDFPDS